MPMPSARAASQIKRTALTTEYGQVTGRLAQPGQFQSGVSARQLASKFPERIAIAGLEIVDHPLPAAGVIHHHEAPRLRKPDGRRLASDLDQPLQRARRQRVRAKPAHVAAPAEQVPQTRAKGLIKMRDGRRIDVHPACAHARRKLPV
jgi:hypothetical protein